ncbi:hypothetical protein K490DRAFT_59414 [Saccharata proteae CBS 121410]|uniref:RNase III domain-containing protein n=1 Tax=Saccharata proteae CBS 121410 TaxID=1314787 RepID=A0A9P4HPL6_9PEZI|nr:hypothetical protein K490DRAFT_59414 [Saccharata proteae CBS 121410]
MTAPVRARPLNPRNVWKVNEDPRALEEAYMKLLGRNGHKILPEDVMWLAVTHKSFDHGRRGFNDRLAFYGKRLLDMQATLAMLSIPTAIKTTHDKYGRPPFIPAALASVGLLDETKKSQLAGKKRLADIAVQCGFDSVIRWKPKQTRDLKASGLDGILTHTMYAIVGALALHRGGAAANELVREKLMMPVSPLPRETEAETAAETSA